MIYEWYIRGTQRNVQTLSTPSTSSSWWWVTRINVSIVIDRDSRKSYMVHQIVGPTISPQRRPLSILISHTWLSHNSLFSSLLSQFFILHFLYFTHEYVTNRPWKIISQIWKVQVSRSPPYETAASQYARMWDINFSNIEAIIKSRGATLVLLRKWGKKELWYRSISDYVWKRRFGSKRLLMVFQTHCLLRHSYHHHHHHHHHNDHDT